MLGSLESFVKYIHFSLSPMLGGMSLEQDHEVEVDSTKIMMFDFFLTLVKLKSTQGVVLDLTLVSVF